MQRTEYFFHMAHQCHKYAVGLRILNPVLAEMYQTASEIWNRLARYPAP